MAPKQLQRIGWFQTSRALVGRAPLADVAQRCGYADQAHPDAGVGALAGCPPSTWLREGSSRSSKTLSGSPRQGGAMSNAADVRLWHTMSFRDADAMASCRAVRGRLHRSLRADGSTYPAYLEADVFRRFVVHAGHGGCGPGREGNQ